jgi:hypothetical protein
MLGEEIRTQYRFVNGGLDERDIWEVAAAEGNGFVDFPQDLIQVPSALARAGPSAVDEECWVPL